GHTVLPGAATTDGRAPRLRTAPRARHPRGHPTSRFGAEEGLVRPPVRSGAREPRSEISSAIGNARAPAWLVHHELPSRSLPWPRRRQRVDLALATRPAPGASPPRSPFRMISLTHLSEPEPPPPAVLQDL